MRRVIAWSVMLIILGIFVVACANNGKGTTDVGGSPTGEATVEDDEDSEETTDQEKDVSGDGLDIHVLSVEITPNLDPMGRAFISTFRAELEVEIGNSGNEIVEFNQIRGIFYEEGQFGSGTKCGKIRSGGPEYCIHWYEEGGIRPFSKPVEIISLEPNRTLAFTIISSSVFYTDLPGTHYVTITAAMDDVPLVETLYEF